MMAVEFYFRVKSIDISRDCGLLVGHCGVSSYVRSSSVRAPHRSSDRKKIFHCFYDFFGKDK